MPRLLDGFLCGEHNLPDGSAGRCRQSGREDFHFRALLIEAWDQEIIELIWFHAKNRFLLTDQLLLHHLNSHSHGSASSALAVARLQHVELPFLDGELKILHIAIVFLQPCSDFAKLVVNLRHDFLQFEDWDRSAHAGNHVLALSVHEEFAVKLLRSGRRIARETHTRAAGVAEVAIYHGLHVDRGPEHVIDVVDAAVVLGAIVLPGAEHSVTSHHQLFMRVLRELALSMLSDDLLVFLNHFLKRLGIQIGIELGFFLLFLSVEHFVEGGFRYFQHHVAEHLDEPPIGVGGKSLIVATLGQRFHALVVQSEIENRVHHARHGKLRARTHAYEQRILARPQFLTL